MRCKNLQIAFSGELLLSFAVYAMIFDIESGFTSCFREINGAWTKMKSRTSDNLRGVWGSSEDNVFAVSEQGTILHYDGNKDGIWTTMPVPNLNPIYGIWGSSENNVFAVGGTWNSSSIFLYDGKDADWTETPANVPNIPRSIWGSSQTDIFAVGDSGMVLRYDGSRWRETDSGTSKYLINVWGTANNVFAVGTDGIILHYGGNSWEKMRSDTLRDLCGVWGSSENDVFIVGRRGVILRYSPEIMAKQKTGQSVAKQKPGQSAQAEPGNENFPTFLGCAL